MNVSSRLEDSDAEVMAGNPQHSSRSGDWKLPCDIPRTLNRLLEECVDVLKGDVDPEVQGILLPKIRQIYQIGSEANHIVSQMAETVERLQDEKELLEAARQSLVGTLEQLEDREHNSASVWKRKFEKAMEELEIAENIIDNLQNASIKTPRTFPEMLESHVTENQNAVIEDLRQRLTRKDEECQMRCSEYREVIERIELHHRQVVAELESAKEIIERENELLLNTQTTYERDLETLRAALVELREKCSKAERENDALEQELKDIMARISEIFARNNLSLGEEFTSIYTNPGEYIARAVQCLAAAVAKFPKTTGLQSEKIDVFPSEISQDEVSTNIRQEGANTKGAEVHYHFHYHAHQHEHTHMHKHGHQHFYGRKQAEGNIEGAVKNKGNVVQSITDELSGKKISAKVCAA